MTFHHGVKVVEVTEGARPLRTIATSVIGFVATAPDADEDVFPLNTPVQFTNLATAMAAAGATGTLLESLRAIDNQVRTIVQIVRVEAGADAAAATANVVGAVDDNGRRTGLQALLDAESRLGVRPRILGAPGLENVAVKTALITVAEKLNAMAYAKAEGDANADAIGDRANYGKRELMLLSASPQALSATGSIATTHIAALALGIRAMLDQTVGWHKSISNTAINGVVGMARPISFDLQSMANDAGELNAADVTTIVRREGFRFWGNRTCSDEPKFAFEVATRTAQVLRDTIAEGLMWAVDKPLNEALIKSVLSTINNKFTQLKIQGYIMGGEATYDPDKNPPESLADGKLYIDYKYGYVSPAEGIHLTQFVTDEYYANLKTAA